MNSREKALASLNHFVVEQVEILRKQADDFESAHRLFVTRLNGLNERPILLSESVWDLLEKAKLHGNRDWLDGDDFMAGAARYPQNDDERRGAALWNRLGCIIPQQCARDRVIDKLILSYVRATPWIVRIVEEEMHKRAMHENKTNVPCVQCGCNRTCCGNDGEVTNDVIDSCARRILGALGTTDEAKSFN